MQFFMDINIMHLLNILNIEINLFGLQNTLGNYSPFSDYQGKGSLWLLDRYVLLEEIFDFRGLVQCQIK